jgi:hypothetical protein
MLRFFTVLLAATLIAFRFLRGGKRLTGDGPPAQAPRTRDTALPGVSEPRPERGVSSRQ